MSAVVVGLGSLASVSFVDADSASVSGFSDNFEDGNTSGWSKSGGAWSVVSDGSHVLKQAKTGTTLARQFAGLTDWADYSLRVGVKPLSVAAGGYAAIVARSTSATSFYRLVSATAGAFAKGRIGVQTYHATAEFDDVAVTVGGTSAPATSPTATASPTATTSPIATTSPSATPTDRRERWLREQPDRVRRGTTGGAGGPTVTITSLGQLIEEAASTGPKILQLSTVLAGSGDDQVVVSSNKTIVGTTANAGLTGAGFFIKKASNVIIRNLKISFAQAPTDLIAAQVSDHIWIDHNELFNDTSHGKDFYDGMIDLTHATDFTTVSWNYLHDHFKGSLVGHSDSNAAEDTGHQIRWT